MKTRKEFMHDRTTPKLEAHTLHSLWNNLINPWTIDLTAESSRLFMARVFTWMTVGLVLTYITAVLFGTTELVNYMVELRVDGSIGMKPLA